MLTPGTSTDPLRIGLTDTDGRLNGVVDEVRLYSRALREWETFLDDIRSTAGRDPTVDEVLAKAETMAKRYGFHWKP